MGPFDLKVVLHQLNRGINHLLHGSQTLFAYTEFNFSFCKCRFFTVSPFLLKWPISDIQVTMISLTNMSHII